MQSLQDDFNAFPSLTKGKLRKREQSRRSYLKTRPSLGRTGEAKSYKPRGYWAWLASQPKAKYHVETYWHTQALVEELKKLGFYTQTIQTTKGFQVLKLVLFNGGING